TAPVARAGRRIGAAVLGVAALVPALSPGLAEGVLNLGGTGFGAGSGSGAITTNNPIVTLRRDLNLPANLPLMWVRTTGARADSQYLRLVSLDVFNGEEWQPSRRNVQPVPDELPAPEALSDEVARRAVRNQISVSHGYAAQWLPLPHPVTRVEIDGEWRYGEDEGDIVGAPGQTTAGITYRTTSLAVTPSREQLRGAVPPPEEISDRYTQLPDDLPPVVGRLARKVAGDRPTAYDQALALQEWFTDPREFGYDAMARSGNSSNALAEFLRDREGYCEQFAATMAVMARLLGIPARVAVGFTPGELRPGGSYRIGAHDAHAWPELFFSGVGWVRFEPTPTIGGGRGSTPNWALPELPQGDPGSSPGSQPGVPRGADPDASGCQVAPGLPECRGQLGEAQVGPLDGGRRGAGDGLARWPFAAGAASLLLGLTPMMLRFALRRRRFSASTDPVRRAQGAWAELRDCAHDLGYAWSPAQTIRQATGRLIREGRLEGPAKDALGRIVGAVERARYARAPGDVGDVFADVRAVRAALAAQAGARTLWRARLFPPSQLSRLWRSVERAVGGLHKVDRRTSRWAERQRGRLPRLLGG
ncbi:MAG: transglutaminaseTgpA domain-containing protein, partial [Carbonactinosporaceae bacterium]